MMRILRFGAPLAIALAMVAAFGGSALADGHTATINFHLRECPTDAVEIFADCHDNALAGIWVSPYDDDYAETDADGNASFMVAPGVYSWWIDGVDWLAIGDHHILTFCSDASNPTVNILENDTFEIDDDEVVTCDIYFHNPELDPAHPGTSGGTTAPPATGVGAASNTALPMAFAGALALAGLAVASRKRSFR
jgi:hypothetical protein